MAVGYRRRELPAPAEKVHELEQRIGCRLPIDYRQYLLEQDGGRLEDNHEAMKTIFGIGEVPEWADLWETIDIYKGRVPQWLLPVAEDEYGNLFCVSLRTSDEGAVWFWDHEEEASQGEPPTEENLALKAADWSSFVSGLQPVQV